MSSNASDNPSMAERLNFQAIDNSVRESLRELKPFLSRVLPGLLDDFYAHVRSYPNVYEVFNSSTIEHVKEKQIQHWLIIAEGDFGATYENSVRTIWTIHARLGLNPSWFLGGYSLLSSGITRELAVAYGGDKKLQDQLTRYADAVMKATLLDLDFAIEVYMAEGEKTRKDSLNKLAEGFETTVLSVVQQVADASNDLSSTAREMSEAASRTSETSSTVAASAEEATANVSVVATSADQMGDSVSEIAGQVSQSAQITASAVERAEQTSMTMESLSKAADKIGEVVSLISDIAAQTNLLALNATIESARAGEAGRGFAVVASEVKSLANQTAKATEDIGTQIQEMQSISKKSVDAISEIRGTIDEINSISVAINAAVEEQSAATQEIARNTQEAAHGAKDVSSNIVVVLEDAQRTGTSAAEVVAASEQLGGQAEVLKAEVGKFLDTVRAA